MEQARQGQRLCLAAGVGGGSGGTGRSCCTPPARCGEDAPSGAPHVECGPPKAQVICLGLAPDAMLGQFAPSRPCDTGFALPAAEAPQAAPYAAQRPCVETRAARLQASEAPLLPPCRPCPAPAGGAPQCSVSLALGCCRLMRPLASRDILQCVLEKPIAGQCPGQPGRDKFGRLTNLRRHISTSPNPPALLLF